MKTLFLSVSLLALLNGEIWAIKVVNTFHSNQIIVFNAEEIPRSFRKDVPPGSKEIILKPFIQSIQQLMQNLNKEKVFFGAYLRTRARGCVGSLVLLRTTNPEEIDNHLVVNIFPDPQKPGYADCTLELKGG